MSLSWIFSSSSSNSSSSSTVTSSSSLIQSPSSTNTPAKFNYATLMSSSTSLAVISAVVAGSVGTGFAAWRWLTSSDIPLSMRIKLGILRTIGAVLHRFLITWPSSKDVNICHWDIVVDESDDIGHRGDESDSQSNSKSESDSNSELDSESSATKRTHHVMVVVPKVDGDSSVDYSRIYINWHGGGFAGGFAKEDIEFCGRMVTELKCVAVLCTYRFAPENPYPAGFNDCVAVFRWFRKRYPQATITVGGFSAGGTLALNVAYKFHKDIAAVIAFYPPMNFSDESDNDFSEKNPYIRCVFHEAYLRHLPQTDSSKSLLKDPCLSPSYATSDTLPPHVALIAAEIDPNTRDMKKFMDAMERARPPRNDNDNDNHNDNHNNNNHNNDSQQSGAVTATSHFLSGNHSLTINKSFSGKVFKKTMHGWANLPDWILLNFLAKARAEAFAMAISTIAKGFATHSESQ